MRGMTIEAVDKDNVDQRGFFGAVDLGEAIRLDFLKIRHVFLEEKSEDMREERRQGRENSQEWEIREKKREMRLIWGKCNI